MLRAFLTQRQIPWREDASNAAPTYQRNRVRQLLDARPELVPPLLEVAERFGELSRRLDRQAPAIDEKLAVAMLRTLHPLVQLHTLRRWLLDRGVAGDGVSLALLERVRTMVEDSASPAGLSAPGGVEVRRSQGKLRVEMRQRS